MRLVNRKTRDLSAIFLLGVVGISSAAVAQTAADRLPPALLACADEVDVMRRLSCYDREMTTLQAAPIPDTPAAPEASAATEAIAANEAPAAVPEAAADPQPATAAKDDFGIDREPREITAQVVDIRRRPYGELVILLDNQQIWEQKHVDRRFKLEIGDKVTVKKGAVGGYWLSGRTNNAIQVQRRK